jgi:quercetin dioxygenase-like cupin family protein
MIRKSQFIAALALSAAAIVGGFAATAANDAEVRPVYAGALPNVPGKILNAVLVSYAPGGKSATHYHAGSVFAYVISGQIRSQISTDSAPKVYKAGESFFEPPGSSHLVSENASATEPASLLAVIVADDGATLTQPGTAKP